MQTLTGRPGLINCLLASSSMQDGSARRTEKLTSSITPNELAGCPFCPPDRSRTFGTKWSRSEEHTSELQSQSHLVCRLLLVKQNGDTSPPVRPSFHPRRLSTLPPCPLA